MGAGSPHPLIREDSGNTRQSQCLSREGSGNTRQRQCLTVVGASNVQHEGAVRHREQTATWDDLGTRLGEGLGAREKQRWGRA